MTPQKATPIKAVLSKGAVHCPMCTHTVDADVVRMGRRVFVKPGLKCPRCAASLDAGYILGFDRAA